MTNITVIGESSGSSVALYRAEVDTIEGREAHFTWAEEPEPQKDLASALDVVHSERDRARHGHDRSFSDAVSLGFLQPDVLTDPAAAEYMEDLGGPSRSELKHMAGIARAVLESAQDRSYREVLGVAELIMVSPFLATTTHGALCLEPEADGMYGDGIAPGIAVPADTLPSLPDGASPKVVLVCE